MDCSQPHILLCLTLIPIWWIALWGILEHAIYYVTRGNVVKEIMVYAALLLATYILILQYPGTVLSHA
jgi:hypothetical protein